MEKAEKLIPKLSFLSKNSEYWWRNKGLMHHFCESLHSNKRPTSNSICKTSAYASHHILNETLSFEQWWGLNGQHFCMDGQALGTKDRGFLAAKHGRKMFCAHKTKWNHTRRAEDKLGSMESHVVLLPSVSPSIVCPETYTILLIKFALFSSWRSLGLTAGLAI